MAKINLLPWRQEQRKEQQRQFLTIVGLVAVLVALGILAVHLQYARLIGVQESRNEYLTKHIKEVEKQIKEINQLANKKERLLARMEIIQRLQRNRPEIVRLFDEMVRILPEGVHLKSLSQKGTKLSLKGVAQSNARVSALMRNIDQSDWLTSPELGVIQTGKGKDGSREFSLTAKQKFQARNNADEKKKATKGTKK